MTKVLRLTHYVAHYETHFGVGERSEQGATPPSYSCSYSYIYINSYNYNYNST